jgi:hypothetical protein
MSRGIINSTEKEHAMSLTEIVIEGTLKPDGTLELHQKPNLLPGRVTVVLRREAEIALPKDDPFWQRMQAIWDAQKAAGHVPRSTEEIALEQREMREGWAKRQKAIEQLQEEASRPRTTEGEAPK